MVSHWYGLWHFNCIITASFLQAIKSTCYASSYKVQCSAVICWFLIAMIGMIQSSLVLFMSCFLKDPLKYGFLVVVTLDCGHPCFWNFYSALVVVVESYVNCLFEPMCVPVKVTINKLYFIAKSVMYSTVMGMLCNGRGVGMGESDISDMFFNQITLGSAVFA